MDDRPFILCVEDDPSARDMLVRGLRIWNYRAEGAADGVECLEWLAAKDCDLVLLDLSMPRMDGIDCVRRIRETFGPDALPVIMVSARAQTESIVAGLDAGANDYVIKPIDMTVLEARIRSCLRARQAVSALVESERQRVMIETLGRSAARLAEPVERVVDTLERYTRPETEFRRAGFGLPASRDRVVEMLAQVEQIVDVIERLRAAGREDADVPYARRLAMLLGDDHPPREDADADGSE